LVCVCKSRWFARGMAAGKENIGYSQFAYEVYGCGFGGKYVNIEQLLGLY